MMSALSSEVSASRRSAILVRLWLPLLLVLPILAGCQVMLISEYDADIDQQATVLQKKMDAFLTKMEGVSDKPAGSYEQNKGFYADYAVEVRSVQVRAGSHEKNGITVKELDEMLKSIETLRALHEGQGKLSAVSAGEFRSLFNQGWQAVITLEMAKKRGQTSNSS